MKRFVEIEKGFFIDKNDIKVIVDCSRMNNKFQKLIKDCKMNDNLRKKEIERYKNLRERGIYEELNLTYTRRYFTHSNKSEDGTYRYIVTKDNKLHSSSLSLEELKNRCFEAGLNLIDMSDMASVNLSYINGIYDIQNDLTSASYRTWCTEVAILQFVSSNSFKSNTILWLTTNELIKLSKSTQEILEQIDKLK